jgi:hypothetical protein
MYSTSTAPGTLEGAIVGYPKEKQVWLKPGDKESPIKGVQRRATWAVPEV